MKAVWKFEITRDEEVRMPVGAQILSVGTQGQRLMCWVLVDPYNLDTEIVRFKVMPTGGEIPDEEVLHFLGTVQFPPLVFHVFRRM